MAGDEIRLAREPFEPGPELDAFAARLAGEGAVATFTGFARPGAAGGGRIDRLFLDHHPRLTLRSMEAIAADARRLFDVTRLRIVHRIGEVSPGEAIVFVAAASAHRRAALQATDYLMDRLKTEAVFWKREDGPHGSSWIDPREEDYADRARWSDMCPE